jgi:hypothetical protein
MQTLIATQKLRIGTKEISSKESFTVSDRKAAVLLGAKMAKSPKTTSNKPEK